MPTIIKNNLRQELEDMLEASDADLKEAKI